jgi:outer membrane biosynthesis protein TonB
MANVARVWNPLSRPVQVSVNGVMVAGLTESDVDLDDVVAAAALTAGDIVLLAPTKTVSVAESVEPQQTEEVAVPADSDEPEEAPTEEEEAPEPAPRPRKKPATQAKES